MKRDYDGRYISFALKRCDQSIALVGLQSNQHGEEFMAVSRLSRDLYVYLPIHGEGAEE